MSTEAESRNTGEFVNYTCQVRKLGKQNVQCIEEDGMVYFEFWSDSFDGSVLVKADEHLNTLQDLRKRPRNLREETTLQAMSLLAGNQASAKVRDAQ